MISLKNIKICEGWMDEVVSSFVKRMRLGQVLEEGQNLNRWWEWGRKFI